MAFEATMLAAGGLGLLHLGLSYRVTQRRVGARVSIGDGGDPEMLTRMRTQANLAEYAPLVLLLMAVVEGDAGSTTALWVAAVVLIAGRIAHAIGMHRPAPNPWRIFGIAATWTLLGLLSLAALLRALT